MDEKDRKIRELEQKIKEMQREMDTLRREASQLPHGAWPSRPGMETFRYDRRPAPPPKAQPLRIILIVAGSLTALVTAVAVMLLLAFALMNTVDKESTALAEEMLQAIVDEDADWAYALTYPGTLKRDEFGPEFEEMCAIWRSGGGDSFQLKRTSWSMNFSGGVTEYVSIYEVASGEARFTFTLTRLARGETTGIAGAQLRR